MSYKNEGRSNYPRGVYLTPDTTASAEWLGSIGNEKNIPLAKLIEIQSADSLNNFYPMEVIATAEETKQLLQKHTGDDYLVFPEDRLHPVKMINDLSQRWIETGEKNNFAGEAGKG